MYAVGKLSAVDVCQSAQSLQPHASLHGVADLIVAAPRAHGGNCARQVDRAAGLENFTQEKVYWDTLPCHCKKTGRSVWRQQPFVLPHELAHHLALTAPETLVIRNQEVWDLPRVAQNRTVLAHGRNVCLCRVYVDGVPYQGRARTAPDSVLVFCWSPVLGETSRETRYPITVLRKADACRCGCGGRCSMSRIMEIIDWSFRHLRLQQHPTARADGQALPRDRARLAGSALSVRGALVEAGCDMAELNHTFGYRGASSNAGCCAKCERSLANLYDCVGEYPRRTQAGYLQELAYSRISVSASAADAAALQAALSCSDRTDLKGRVLTVSVCDLAAGSRLECGGRLRDVHQDLNTLEVFPAPLVLWRRMPGGCVNYPSPLLEGELDVEDLVTDLLHTVDGGVAQYCGGAIFGSLIESRTTGARQFADMESYQKSVARWAEPRLQSWYMLPEQSRATVLTTLTCGIMLGPGGMTRPCLKAKAMENRWLFRYAKHELEQHAEVLEAAGGSIALRARRLAAAAARLEDFYTSLYSHGLRVPEQECQRLLSVVTGHIALMRGAGTDLAPKHHNWYEMVLGMPRNGNPLF